MPVSPVGSSQVARGVASSRPVAKIEAGLTALTSTMGLDGNAAAMVKRLAKNAAADPKLDANVAELERLASKHILGDPGQQKIMWRPAAGTTLALLNHLDNPKLAPHRALMCSLGFSALKGMTPTDMGMAAYLINRMDKIAERLTRRPETRQAFQIIDRTLKTSRSDTKVRIAKYALDFFIEWPDRALPPLIQDKLGTILSKASDKTLRGFSHVLVSCSEGSLPTNGDERDFEKIWNAWMRSDFMKLSLGPGLKQIGL